MTSSISVAPAQTPNNRGCGRGGAKRAAGAHLHVRNSINGIGAPSLRRLARRAGVKRLSAPIFDEVRVVLREFLDGVVRDAVVFSEYAHRKTVTTMDVLHALKRNGRTLYGFGG